MSSPALVSIVGVSRSGTTLMRNVLNRSSSVAVASENYFLGHLVKSQGMRRILCDRFSLANDDDLRRLVDFIYSGEFRQVTWQKNWGYWRWLRDNVSREKLIRRLTRSDRTERALFLALVGAYAEAQGKPILGEKTPSHFRYLEQLFDWFPDAKVVHMVRDPRGNWWSEWRRRGRQKPHELPGPYRLAKRTDTSLKGLITAVVTYAWGEAMRARAWARREVPRSYLVVRFEDLVAAQGREIRRICRFLDIPFEPQMLDQEVVSRGHKQGMKGFDREAAKRWKEGIDPWVDRWFRTVFRHPLNDLGYLGNEGDDA